MTKTKTPWSVKSTVSIVGLHYCHQPTHPNNSGTAYVFHPTYVEPEKIFFSDQSFIVVVESGNSLPRGRIRMIAQCYIWLLLSSNPSARRNASAAALRPSSDMRSISSSNAGAPYRPVPHPLLARPPHRW